MGKSQVSIDLINGCASGWRRCHCCNRSACRYLEGVVEPSAKCPPCTNMYSFVRPSLRIWPADLKRQEPRLLVGMRRANKQQNFRPPPLRLGLLDLYCGSE